MDTTTLNECMNLSLEGKITFPEVISRLKEAGVERYNVDLASFQKHAYGDQGEYLSSSFSLPNPPAISKKFDEEALKDALLSIQSQKSNYQEFLRQIMSSGCCHYEVYIDGKRAIYFGRDGSQYLEHFGF